MTSLTRAIVRHDLEGIESTLADDPSLVNVPETGWLPIRWALTGGNIVTLARFLRASRLQDPSVDPTGLLRRYVEMLAADEYEPYAFGQAVTALWHDLYEGTTHLVGRFKRPLVPSLGQADDLRFLIGWCGASSADMLYRRLCA